MSLLDGLNEELRNPLLEGEQDFRLAMECDFDAALEAATEKCLSDADVAAILNGEDDLPPEELEVEDPDDPRDDLDQDIPETVKPAHESDLDIEGILESLGAIGSEDEGETDSDPEPDGRTAEEIAAECDTLLEACGGSSCDDPKPEDIATEEPEDTPNPPSDEEDEDTVVEPATDSDDEEDISDLGLDPLPPEEQAQESDDAFESLLQQCLENV